MCTSSNEIIRYDGRTLAVTTHPSIQIEARRGRRWGWFGQKGWWVHLHLFHGWHVKKFVLTLADAGVTPVVPAPLLEEERTIEFASPFVEEPASE